MADIKWIKITTDIFNDEKILLMEQMPDADSLIVIWFKLLCMAGKENNYGVFMMRNRMPYTEEMLATIFRRPLNTVRMALATFEAYGMIEIDDDIITIPNWEKHQNIDGMDRVKEQNRIRQQRYRERKKQALLCDNNVTSRNCHGTDKNRKEEEKEEDIDNISDSDESAPAPVKKSKPVKHKHGEYKHVLLTDEEVDKLKKEYGEAMTGNAIVFLDEYIEMKGYKAKSHYLAIRKWVVDAVKERDQKKGRKEMVPDWMNKKPKNAFNGYSNRSEYDMDSLEKELFGNEPKTAGNDPEVAAKAEALKKELGGV